MIRYWVTIHGNPPADHFLYGNTADRDLQRLKEEALKGKPHTIRKRVNGEWVKQ